MQYDYLNKKSWIANLNTPVKSINEKHLIRKTQIKGHKGHRKYND